MLKWADIENKELISMDLVKTLTSIWYLTDGGHLIVLT